MHTIQKNICGQEITLTNQRAAFWKEQSAIIISDMHVGKTAYFRKNGIPVPADILEDDLRRLTSIQEYFQAEKIFIVGDFLHSGKNTDFAIFEKWRAQYADLQITIIKGNHDIKNADFLQELGVTIEDDALYVDPFLFIHIPDDSRNEFSISGHLHPGVSVQLERRKSVRLPCFRISENQLILPAFSKFTGLDTQSCRDYDCIAFTDDFIFEL